jgi:hypothetical protein
MNVHSDIDNSQKGEKINDHALKNGKWNMVFSYSRMLFCPTKEWRSNTCYNRDEPWKYYAEVKSQMQNKTHYIISYTQYT